MATSFLISYPAIPFTALQITSSGTFDEDLRMENLFYGQRSNWGRLAGNASSYSLTFDLGLGKTSSIDHLILGDASPLVAAGVTGCRIQGSTDGVTWVDQLGTAAIFATRTATGLYSRDIIFTQAVNDTFGATLASYRYWKFSFATSGSHKFPFSKLYFGPFLDMGKEPSNYDIESFTDSEDTWRAPRGQVLMTRTAYPRHRITIEYDGISDAKVIELFSKVLRNPFKSTVWLYAATFSDPLYGNGLMYCRPVLDECSSVQKKKSGDWNDVSLVFEEV